MRNASANRARRAVWLATALLCAAAGAFAQTPVARNIADETAQFARARASVVGIGMREDVVDDAAGASGRKKPVIRRLGSGFVASADGRIITKASVVLDAQPLVVILPDGKTIDARLSGIDRLGDLAVLKIDARALPALPILRGVSALPMQIIAAVGANDRMETLVVAGIVAPANRLRVETPPHVYYPPIYAVAMFARHANSALATPPHKAQLNAAYDPLSVGGPVVNQAGEAVGVLAGVKDLDQGLVMSSVPIYGPFAAALDQLLAEGAVRRGRLGIIPQEFRDPLASAMGFPQASVLVAAVEPGSPAEQAGMLPGDVILTIDKRRVSGQSGLLRAMLDRKPGSSVALEVMRGGTARQLTATVGATRGFTPDDAVSRQDAEPHPLRTEALNQLGEEPVVPGGWPFNRPATDGPLVVRAVATGAAQGVRVTEARGTGKGAALLPGDIILQVNKSPVADDAQFDRAMQQPNPRGLLDLLVSREGRVEVITLESGAAR